MNSCRDLHRTGSCYFSVKQLKDILDACCSWRAGRVIYKDLLFGFLFVCDHWFWFDGVFLWWRKNTPTLKSSIYRSGER